MVWSTGPPGFRNRLSEAVSSWVSRPVVQNHSEVNLIEPNKPENA